MRLPPLGLASALARAFFTPLPPTPGRMRIAEYLFVQGAELRKEWIEWEHYVFMKQQGRDKKQWGLRALGSWLGASASFARSGGTDDGKAGRWGRLARSPFGGRSR